VAICPPVTRTAPAPPLSLARLSAHRLARGLDMAQRPLLHPLLLPGASVPTEGRLTIAVWGLRLERDDAEWRQPMVLLQFQHNAESVSKPAERKGPCEFIWDHKAT
jgi:hypothetical protein